MRSGKVEVTKAPSRLCKANLYKRWLELCRKMEMLYARPTSEGKLYSEIKVRLRAARIGFVLLLEAELGMH